MIKVLKKFDPGKSQQKKQPDDPFEFSHIVDDDVATFKFEDGKIGRLACKLC